MSTISPIFNLVPSHDRSNDLLVNTRQLFNSVPSLGRSNDLLVNTRQLFNLVPSYVRSDYLLPGITRRQNIIIPNNNTNISINDTKECDVYDKIKYNIY
jgi:hypothetical protein